MKREYILKEELGIYLNPVTGNTEKQDLFDDWCATHVPHLLNRADYWAQFDFEALEKAGIRINVANYEEYIQNESGSVEAGNPNCIGYLDLRD